MLRGIQKTKANAKANKRRTLLTILSLMVLSIIVVNEHYQAQHSSYDDVDVRDRNSNRYSNRNSNSNINGGDTIRKTCASVLDRFDRIFDERRKVRQEKVSDGGLFVWESAKKKNKAMWFWDMYEPEAACFMEERLGYGSHSWRKEVPEDLEPTLKRYDSFGDGPKFVCGVDLMSSLETKQQQQQQQRDDDDTDSCLVYSIGSNNNVAFEMSIHKFMGCETHTFDPTVSKKDFVGDKYTTFHEWGLGKDGVSAEKDGKRWNGKSFRTILRELGHLHRTIDILKIDCEGCEWETMPPLFDLIAAGTVKVHQIQIEMHNALYGIEKSDADLNSFFEKLDNAKMRIVHKERNHWGCQGFQCLEYAFVSEEFLRNANREAVC